MMIISFFTFLLALSLGLYLTPLAIRAALSLNIVARPDGRLRTHEQPVPYLGGVAVYLAMLLSLTLVVEFSPVILGLLLGTTIVLMVGLIDDFGVMTPKVKLFGQVIAALALAKGGILLELEIFNLRWPFELPLFSWVLSTLWLVGLANAMNFLDIEDGLAGGVAAASCPALFVVAWLNGRTGAAMFTAALFGATLAFLRFNAPLPRAKIYLGDAGSLFLGVSLAALAMIGSYTEKNNLGAICPVIILGVPCFEIMVTMAARWRKGAPVWHGSADHVAKRLQQAGLGKRATVALHCAVSLALGGLAILIMNLDITWAIAVVSGLAAVTSAVFYLLLRVKVNEAPAGAGS